MTIQIDLPQGLSAQERLRLKHLARETYTENFGDWRETHWIIQTSVNLQVSAPTGKVIDKLFTPLLAELKEIYTERKKS